MKISSSCRRAIVPLVLAGAWRLGRHRGLGVQSPDGSWNLSSSSAGGRTNIFLYDEWLSSGERVALEPRSRRAAPLPTFHIFCRVSGRTAAPWFTLLHGFPSSSWDYAKVLLGLEAEFRVVAFDFLGFGNFG